MEFGTDVLVLGAGITGLYSAYCLGQRGLKTAVVEKEANSGGLCSTVNFGNSFFDLGGHRLYFKNQRLKKDIFALIGEKNLLQHKRKSAICSGKKFFSYPPDIKSVYFFLSKFFFESGSRPSGEKAGRDSLETWMIKNYGKKIYRIYFEDYTEKAWGLPASKIAAVWAEKRIDKANFFKLVFDAVLKLGEVKENASTFYYPRAGIKALPEALEKTAGAEMFFGAEKLSISSAGGKVLSAEFEKNGKRTRIKFKKLLSTIPLAELLPALDAGGTTGLAAKAGGIRYRSLMVAFISGKRREKLPYHWIYFPEKNIFFSRACELSNWSGKSAPGGELPLTFEIFCDYRDRVWEMQDGQIAAKILSDCLSIPGISFPKAEKLKVVRIRYAYPLLYLGYEKALNDAMAGLSGLKNLYLCGRNGRHSYYDTEECLLDAEKTAGEMTSDVKFKPEQL